MEKLTPVELTVRAKGAVTLPVAALRHLGIKPGDKIEIALLDGGRVQLAPPAARAFGRLRGALQRPGQLEVSLEQMHNAIETGRRR